MRGHTPRTLCSSLQLFPVPVAQNTRTSVEILPADSVGPRQPVHRLPGLYSTWNRAPHTLSNQRNRSKFDHVAEKQPIDGHEQLRREPANVQVASENLHPDVLQRFRLYELHVQNGNLPQQCHQCFVFDTDRLLHQSC